jgi:hypothetical protein
VSTLTLDQQKVVMKALANNERNNAMAVQQKTTLRMTRQVITWFRRALLATVIVTTAMPAMSTCGTNSCSDKIGRLDVSVANHSTAQGDPNCSLASNWYFTLSPIGRFYAQTYDLFLRAKTASAPVIIRAVDTAGCASADVVAEP